MKSSYRDHVKATFKPTLFGLLQSQYDSILSNVYAYIYNKQVWSSAFISTCRGAVSGHYRNVTLAEVEGEFDAYAFNPELQNKILERVNQYVTDFKSSMVFPPTADALARLLQVRDYFQARIDKRQVTLAATCKA